jgi:hypothetical protein
MKLSSQEDARDVPKNPPNYPGTLELLYVSLDVVEAITKFGTGSGRLPDEQGRFAGRQLLQKARTSALIVSGVTANSTSTSSLLDVHPSP